MELRDYLRIMRRRWVSILLVAGVLLGLAVAFTALKTPSYSSHARLFVTTTAQSDQGGLLQGSQFSAQRVKSYADLVTSRELANRVAEDLNLSGGPGALSGMVSASVVPDTVNLQLTVTDVDAHEAQRVAQAYAEQLTDLVRELETPPGETTAPVKATIVDSASYSATAVSPSWPRNIGLGLILGLLCGFGVAVLREVLDTRVKSNDEVQELTQAPSLGVIGLDPTMDKTPLITQVPAYSPRAEAFRVLRTNLQFVDVDNPTKVFVVTSAAPDEGKTSTSINLAISLAQAGTRTLLIGGDLRRPKLAERMGIDGVVGLTNVLVGQVELDDVLQDHPASGLTVLPSGSVPPNPAELLQSEAMAQVLGQVRAQFEVVIVDSPPLLPVTDAALIAAKADGAILAVRHGSTTRDQVTHALDRLAQVDAKLAGTVLTMAPAKSKAYGYGYGYGYAPEAATDDKSPRSEGARS